MTTLTLTELWMAPVGDLSDTITINVRTESETVNTGTQVRRYAGGRDRIVATPGVSTPTTFTAMNVDRDTWAQLVDRVGTLQLFREPRGRAIYGTVRAVSGDEWRARESTLGDVQFTVERATYSEVV